MSFWCHSFDQKHNKRFLINDIMYNSKSPGSSKKLPGSPLGGVKKIQVRNPYNIFVAILVETMTPKRHFEINWPLISTNSGFTITILFSTYEQPIQIPNLTTFSIEFFHRLFFEFSSKNKIHLKMPIKILCRPLNSWYWKFRKIGAWMSQVHTPEFELFFVLLIKSVSPISLMQTQVVSSKHHYNKVDSLCKLTKLTKQ